MSREKETAPEEGRRRKAVHEMADITTREYQLLKRAAEEGRLEKEELSLTDRLVAKRLCKMGYLSEGGEESGKCVSDSCEMLGEEPQQKREQGKGKLENAIIALTSFMFGLFFYVLIKSL